MSAGKTLLHQVVGISFVPPVWKIRMKAMQKKSNNGLDLFGPEGRRVCMVGSDTKIARQIPGEQNTTNGGNCARGGSISFDVHTRGET